jgi:hypothetical protein
LSAFTLEEIAGATQKFGEEFQHVSIEGFSFDDESMTSLYMSLKKGGPSTDAKTRQD